MEAGMLDAVLEAFAGRDELDWTQLLELFDGDEELAAAIIDILAGNELVTKSGQQSKHGLPEKISRTEAGIALIEAGGFTAKMKEPEPAPTPVMESREVVFEIENKLPEEQPTEPEPPVQPAPIAKLEPPAAENHEPSADVLLHQEIAQLRFEHRQHEHQLRDKEMIIANLTAQNQTLGNFRIFIWVLLGLIALLIAGLLLRSR